MKIVINANFLDGLSFVFSNRAYLALAIILAAGIGFFYAVSINLIYLDPVFFVNYYRLFDDGAVNLITGILFLLMVPILASLTITIFVYKWNQFRNMKSMNKSMNKGLAEAGLGSIGMFAGLFTSTCAECVPLFLYMAGVTYGMFVATLAPFVIWTRLLAILILGISFYYALREVTNLCSINPKGKTRNARNTKNTRNKMNRGGG